jgi:hypothetical protein
VTTAPVGPWDRNGEDIFGSSSKSPTYKRIDRSEAEKVRDILLQKYPDVMKRDNIGENGGTLAGRMLEIYSDREMCNNCEVVLPKVALELGNPAVTFIDKLGRRFTMRDGN